MDENDRPPRPRSEAWLRHAERAGGAGDQRARTEHGLNHHGLPTHRAQRGFATRSEPGARGTKGRERAHGSPVLPGLPTQRAQRGFATRSEPGARGTKGRERSTALHLARTANAASAAWLRHAERAGGAGDQRARTAHGSPSCTDSQRSERSVASPRGASRGRGGPKGANGARLSILHGLPTQRAQRGFATRSEPGARGTKGREAPDVPR